MSFNQEVTEHPDILNWFRLASRKYGDGRSVSKMAQDMGLQNERSLNNKLNPNSDHAHLSLNDACNILQLSQDVAPLRAMAYLVDHMVMPLPKCESAPQDVLSHFIDVFGACGDVGEAIKNATRDESELGEDLSRRERKEIISHLDELIEATVCLRQSVSE